LDQPHIHFRDSLYRILGTRPHFRGRLLVGNAREYFQWGNFRTTQAEHPPVIMS
jgi:hypothetical protein